jgi:hypothetical protein
VSWALLTAGLVMVAVGLWLTVRAPSPPARHDRRNRFERFHARRDAEQLLQITDELTLRPLLSAGEQRWLAFHLYLAGLLPLATISRRQDDT